MGLSAIASRRMQVQLFERANVEDFGYSCFPFSEDSEWWEVADTACSKPLFDEPECISSNQEQFPQPPQEEASVPIPEREPDLRSEAEEVLDSKLDFILRTVKTRKSPEKGGKFTRTRKTPLQVQVLHLELGKEHKLRRPKMRELAAKTGLKELQIYKWFWDNKKKVKRED